MRRMKRWKKGLALLLTVAMTATMTDGMGLTAYAQNVNATEAAVITESADTNEKTDTEVETDTEENTDVVEEVSDEAKTDAMAEASEETQVSEVTDIEEAADMGELPSGGVTPLDGAVAKIGTTGYETLQDAFDSIHGNGETTITLLKDTKLTEAVDLYGKEADMENGRKWILELSGHTLSGDEITLLRFSTKESPGPGIPYDTTLTIKNGTLKSESCCIEGYGSNTIRLSGVRAESALNVLCYHNQLKLEALDGTVILATGDSNGGACILGDTADDVSKDTILVKDSQILHQNGGSWLQQFYKTPMDIELTILENSLVAGQDSGFLKKGALGTQVVSGNVVLKDTLTLPSFETYDSLFVNPDSSLTIAEDASLTLDGTVKNFGTVVGRDRVHGTIEDGYMVSVDLKKEGFVLEGVNGGVMSRKSTN